MRRWIFIATILSALGVGGCGGGSRSNATQTVSPAGIWLGTESGDNDSLYVIITSSGDFRILRSDLTEYFGALRASGSSFSGSFQALVPEYFDLPDGSTSGTGTISGSVQAGTAISLSISLTTADGTATTTTAQLAPSALYGSGSSLAAVAGTYYDEGDDLTLSIAADGSVYYEQPDDGCLMTGQITILDSKFDIYQEQFAFANCQGANSYLNGTSATGLGVLDRTQSPAVIYMGVTSVAGGYALTAQFVRVTDASSGSSSSSSSSSGSSSGSNSSGGASSSGAASSSSGGASSGSGSSSGSSSGSTSNASVSVNPSSLTFGLQAPGSSSAAQALQISSGSDGVSISAITIAGPGAASFEQSNNCAAPSAVSCGMNVTFSPGTADFQTATLSIMSSGSSTATLVSLSGNVPFWSWIAGSSTADTAGTYGSVGVAAPSSAPGGRSGAVPWSDSSGNLWLFGGMGLDINGDAAYLSDMWEFSPSSGSWVWQNGSDLVNAPGTYGTAGTVAAGNAPPARALAVSWTDPAGNFWLFGGTNESGDFNDLWRYDVGAGEWTWMSGTNSTDAAGSYGSQNVPAPTNAPGARYGAVSWSDPSGKLLLFGGTGYDAGGALGQLNDLWQYDIASGLWTWINGSNTGNTSGSYGTQGMPAAANEPPPRVSAVSWIDSSSNLWLFGGSGVSGFLNDLWRYAPTTGLWLWVSGSSTPGSSGSYGSALVSSAANVPAAREAAVSWVDAAGDFWLLGGYGSLGELNDLWRYDPGAGLWCWVGGARSVNATGVYGNQGMGAATNTPGARSLGISWTDPSGNLWLFGGYGYDSSASLGLLSDLWELVP